MDNLSAVIAVIGCVLMVATFYIGRQSAARSDAKETGALMTDLKYIKESIGRIEKRLNDDVQRLEGRIDEQSKMLLDVASTAGRAHESTKAGHKRLDEHLEREHGLRGRGGGEAS